MNYAQKSFVFNKSSITISPKQGYQSPKNNSMLRQLCNDTCITVLMEYNGVTQKWVTTPFWSDSSVFHENSAASIMAELSQHWCWRLVQTGLKTYLEVAVSGVGDLGRVTLHAAGVVRDKRQWVTDGLHLAVVRYEHQVTSSLLNRALHGIKVHKDSLLLDELALTMVRIVDIPLKMYQYIYCIVVVRKCQQSGSFTLERKPGLSRWVHREFYWVFTLGGDIDQRKNILAFTFALI